MIISSDSGRVAATYTMLITYSKWKVKGWAMFNGNGFLQVE